MNAKVTSRPVWASAPACLLLAAAAAPHGVAAVDQPVAAAASEPSSDKREGRPEGVPRVSPGDRSGLRDAIEALQTDPDSDKRTAQDSVQGGGPNDGFQPASIFFEPTPFVAGVDAIADGLAAADDAGDPGKRLGFRAQILRSSVRVGDVVVITDSPEAAAEAIVWWGTGVRFPVLIDDGTTAAHEDIARFVRAFDPADILHYMPGDAARPWPKDAPGRRAFVRGSLAASLGDVGQRAGQDPQPNAALAVVASDRLPPASDDDIMSRLAGLRVDPHGIVIVDENDASWVAGLALAAGRFQPIAFADASGAVDDVLTQADTLALVDLVNAAADATGLNYDGFGDGIDAVTLVMQTGARGRDVVFGEVRDLAITDRIARGPGPTMPGGAVYGDRRAWGGLISGVPARSLYDAMCGLFLSADSATLFDGYGTPNDGFFDAAASGGDAFDMTAAAAELQERGYQTTVFDNGLSRKSDWELMARAGLSSDLLLVNTMGMPTFFELMGGRVGAESVPTFAEPSLVHFVHSFSAETPGGAATIAGRFRVHGAYAYVGSMHEPGLQAFVGSSIVAERLATGWALGPAVRSGFPGFAWYVNVLGDPLVTLAPASAFPDRVPVASVSGLPLALGALAGLDEFDDAAADPTFERAIRICARRGDDEQAASLAVGAAERDELTPGLAAVAFTPLIRTGRIPLAIRVFGEMDRPERERIAALDSLWHAAWTHVARGGSFDANLERTLAVNPRSPSAADDIGMLADAARARGGVEAERAVLEAAIPKVRHNSNKAMLQARLDALPPANPG